MGCSASLSGGNADSSSSRAASSHVAMGASHRRSAQGARLRSRGSSGRRGHSRFGGDSDGGHDRPGYDDDVQVVHCVDGGDADATLRYAGFTPGSVQHLQHQHLQHQQHGGGNDGPHLSSGVAMGQEAECGLTRTFAGHEPHVDTLFDAYGKPTEQVGYTDGHYCLTKYDREEASRCGSSLLYGEILASGVSKLLDEDHLHAANAQVLYDLGMGVGKLCLQAFLQFPSLRLVFGIELAYSRYKLAEEALARLVSIQPELYEIEERVPGDFIRVHTVGSRRSRRRVIELRRGNMWTVRGINAVDIVVMHTELTLASLGKVRRLIGEMRRGSRFVTYQDLSKHKWYGATGGKPPFEQVPANVSETDQFVTSWSAVKGHHLYCWVKTGPPRQSNSVDEADGFEESKEAIIAPR